MAINREYSIHCRLMAAICAFRHSRTEDSIDSSLYLLSDLGNMAVAIGISLLACIRAEIYVMSYLRLVNGHRL